MLPGYLSHLLALKRMLYHPTDFFSQSVHIAILDKQAIFAIGNDAAWSIVTIEGNDRKAT